MRHYADMERPMRDVLTKHDKSKKFQWSELAERGFREMQVAIRNCAKLYFLKDDPDTQIILRTDASDYGYGKYLCQIVGDREYPVLFMSKSFHTGRYMKNAVRYIRRWKSSNTCSIIGTLYWKPITRIWPS